MGVKKLDGRWVVRWTDELGRDNKKVMPANATKADAARYLLEQQLRADRVRAGFEVRDRNPHNLTVGELAERYLKGKDERLASAVRRHIVNTDLGAARLEKVTTARITVHLAELQPAPPQKAGGRVRKVLSPATRNHVRKHLVQIFAFGVARGLFIGANPARAVKAEKVRRRPLVTLSAEEAARLVVAVEQPWRGIIAVALHGLRRGEIWGLNSEDVDLKRSVIHVRRSNSADLTKNGRERVVPIHVALRGAIKEALDLAEGRGPVLFPGMDKASRRHEMASIDTPFRNALRSAKIDRPLRFHDLRHTAATLLLQAGASIAHVKQILGHSSISLTVDLYGHLITEDLHAAMARVRFELPAPKAVETA